MFFVHNFIPLAFALARLLCLMNGFFQKNRAFEKHVLFKNSLGLANVSAKTVWLRLSCPFCLNSLLSYSAFKLESALVWLG
jgi:hypothetical protein